MIISFKGHLYEAVRDIELMPDEPALMTLKEYIKSQNPEDKSHPDTAYNKDLKGMNDYSYMFTTYIGHYMGEEIIFKTIDKVNGIYYKDDSVIAVLLDNTLYHLKHINSNKIPEVVRSFGFQERLEINHANTKIVKYFNEQLNKILDIPTIINKRYPELISRVKINNELFVLRKSEYSLALTNEDGYVVAEASNEWGANLIMVATEYRGRGIADYIKREWQKLNPNLKSGGYTSAGFKMAQRYWAGRVIEFLSNGWYSELIKQNKITNNKVKEIVSIAKTINIQPNKVPENKPNEEKKILIYSDGISFSIYDSRIYDIEEPTDDLIYAHGFLRSSGDKTYYYKLDYELEYEKVANYVALQMAYDNGYKLYVGEGYSDHIEYDDIPNIVKDKDNIKLSAPIFDLKKYSKYEKEYRKKRDQFNEKLDTMIELSNSKWS